MSNFNSAAVVPQPTSVDGQTIKFNGAYQYEVINFYNYVDVRLMIYIIFLIQLRLQTPPLRRDVIMFSKVIRTICLYIPPLGLWLLEHALTSLLRYIMLSMHGDW